MGVRKEPKAGEAEFQEQLQSYACLLGMGFLMRPSTASSQAFQWAWLHYACPLEVTLAAVPNSRASWGPRGANHCACSPWHAQPIAPGVATLPSPPTVALQPWMQPLWRWSERRKGICNLHEEHEIFALFFHFANSCLLSH